MKTTKTLALIGGLGLLAAAALAQPAPGDNSGPLPPPDRFGGGRPDPEMRRRMLTEKYDANKDGKLDDTELATLGKDVLEGRFGPPPGMNRRGLQGQGGPRAQGPGDDTARVWDSPNRGPRAQGPQGPDGDRPPTARRPGGQGSEGDRPPGPQGGGQPDFGQRGGPDGGPPHRAPMPEREDGSERGQFAPGPGGPGNRSAEFGGKALETRRREFIKKYDADGDGKLSASEREAIGRDIEEGKLPPPPLAPPRPPHPPQQPPPPHPPE